jgi:hypothetical protein
MRVVSLKRLLILLSLVLCTRALASDPIADATAKFLAGLPLKGTPLEKHNTDPGWDSHATDLDRGWDRLEKQQLCKIRAWAPKALGHSYKDTGPMFYMFSGPDFLYANVFFPNASTYILCGIEPVGAVPDIDKIPPADLPSALANLRKSLDSLLNESYFITKYMMTDFKQSQLNGILPVFYVFLARASYTIDSVTRVALDCDGNLVPEGNGTTPGVKIVFFAPNGVKQTLYYFKSDLADRAVIADPGFRKFCEQQGRGAALLKAACYYMKSNKFLMVRDFLLAHSKIILEDDSGIPFSCFDGGKWDTQSYAKSDDESRATRLEFGFGYEWKKTHTTVMIARPK